MKNMTIILLRTFWLLVLFLFACIAFLLTPTGLKFSADSLSYFSNGKFSYQDISGVLIGPIQMSNIKLVDTDQTVLIKKITLDWNPIDLLRGRFQVSRLNINSVRVINNNVHRRITAQSLQESIKYWQNFRLPFDIMIKNAHITDIQISNAHLKPTVIIPNLNFHIIMGNKKWDAQITSDLTTPRVMQWEFNLLGTPSQYHFHMNINGQYTHWQLQGSGDPQKIIMATPSTEFLSGKLALNLQLTLLPKLQWQGNLLASNIDLKEYNPDWPNNFTAEINSHAENAGNIIAETTAHLQSTLGQWNAVLKYNNNWSININSADEKISLILSSQYIKNQLQLSLSKLDVITRNRSDWHLLNPVKFSITENGFNITPFCLSSASLNQACFSGNWSEKLPWKMQLNGDHLPLDWLMQLLQAPVTMTGNFSVHAFMEGSKGEVKSANIKFNTSRGNFKFLVGKKTIQENFTGANFNAVLQAETLSSQFAFNLDKNNFIRANIHLPNFTHKHFSPHDKNVRGNVQIQLSQFNWFGILFPHAKVPQGKLVGNLILSKQWLQPELSGQIQFQNGQILLPNYGITLSKMSMALNAKNNFLNFALTAYSKDQPIVLQGKTDFTHFAKFDFPTTINIKANNALLLNTDEFIAYFTTDLVLKTQGRNISITGNIIIPTATIKPNDVESTTQLPDGDIIYVGEKFNHPKSQWNITSDLIITFEKNVNLIASGANAYLEGKLHLMGQPDQDTLATGEISVVKGIYDVYGRTLTISPTSNISYTNSPLDNPALDISATRLIVPISSMGADNYGESNIIVGVAVHGVLKAPKISFFSRPANLSQTDILSYLLLGYSGQQGAAGSTDFLLRALSSVKISGQGLMGKQNIASQIQNGLGLNELGVESETTVDEVGTPLSSQSAFVVGKRLARHFYVRYSVGLLDPVSVFQIRYMFAKNWTLQADSSTLGNGMDVLYTINKD